MARTKEEAQSELMEMFGFRDTAGFKKLLSAGDFETAERAINHIEENLNQFPQYSYDWLRDRKSEIGIAQKRLEKGESLPEARRSKGEAIADLREKFGFADTAGFRRAIAEDRAEEAKRWLEYICADPGNFPQYLATWDNWLADRRRELENSG